MPRRTFQQQTDLNEVVESKHITMRARNLINFPAFKAETINLGPARASHRALVASLQSNANINKKFKYLQVQDLSYVDEGNSWMGQSGSSRLL